MFFKIALFVIISLVLPLIAASGPVTTRTNDLTILPEDCSIVVAEEMPLALEGALHQLPSLAGTWTMEVLLPFFRERMPSWLRPPSLGWSPSRLVSGPP